MQQINIFDIVCDCIDVSLFVYQHFQCSFAYTPIRHSDQITENSFIFGFVWCIRIFIWVNGFVKDG